MDRGGPIRVTSSLCRSLRFLCRCFLCRRFCCRFWCCLRGHIVPPSRRLCTFFKPVYPNNQEKCDVRHVICGTTDVHGKSSCRFVISDNYNSPPGDNRHRGRPSDRSPATPPGMRVRTGRFEKLRLPRALQSVTRRTHFITNRFDGGFTFAFAIRPGIPGF